VKDVPIRKGTVVNIQPRGNHYNPKYFKDPNVFKPERWESECDNIHPYALGGFGSGPKNCLGKQLSYL
jgi:cytochrome P450